MKYNLYCFLFGHKWYVETDKFEMFNGKEYKRTCRVISNWCTNCGLTKKEAGISINPSEE